MNVGCMIYHYGERYEQLGRCARDSFARFHPDVTLHHVDEIKEREYIRKVGPLHTECKGIFKYMLAYEIMIKHEYDKMIILGGEKGASSLIVRRNANQQGSAFSVATGM